MRHRAPSIADSADRTANCPAARRAGSLSPWPAALSSNARVWALSASGAQAFVAGSVAFDTESFAASAALEAVCDARLYESSASESQSSTPEPERLLMMTATAAIMPPTISTPMRNLFIASSLVTERRPAYALGCQKVHPGSDFGPGSRRTWTDQ